ncbi:hypothetical protein BGP77_09675 [Saccharospirillum sp. MSK14-1]|uniref:hypothetical protein n=1 Tax=Saccharospirillum sp. MSK14-1 TaxID=1897632 RepID=UPI000D3B2E76|nr:hypothetical protein [Saccharospirillum sp. MSK14-1]PTY39011.1 hypothetical protein BGP77_09675 [Saccharospirillum sp. MSK14-1]
MNRSALSLKLRLQLERLQLRERLLLLIATMVVLAAAGYGLGLLSGISEHESQRQRLEQLTLEHTANTAALGNLTQARDNPVVIQLSERNAALEAELAELDARMANITEVLIPPQQMVSVLRELLERSDLTLIRLSVQPVSEVRPADVGQSALYQHKLELTLTGTFNDLTAYLSALEGLPWHLFWDRLSIETTEHPQLRIHLDVHTLSDQEVWMNV